MDSPQFLQQMSSLMSNPAIVDQIIASNPNLQNMGPQIRQVFQSEQFRQMMYVPTENSLSSPHVPCILQGQPRVIADHAANVVDAS